MSVEIRPDTGPGWTETVFIDDIQLRLQVCENPYVDDGICVVRCITDKNKHEPLDPDTVPYQVKPYTKEIGKQEPLKGVEITTFYLKYH